MFYTNEVLGLKKHRYRQLYAKNSISMDEMLTLLMEAEKREDKKHWAKMGLGDKVIVTLLGCLAAVVGRTREP